MIDVKALYANPNIGNALYGSLALPLELITYGKGFFIGQKFSDTERDAFSLRVAFEDRELFSEGQEVFCKMRDGTFAKLKVEKIESDLPLNAILICSFFSWETP